MKKILFVSLLVTLVGCRTSQATLQALPSQDQTFNSAAAPTSDVDAIFTNAASTVSAQLTIIPHQTVDGFIYMNPDVSITNADGSEMRMGPPGTLPNGLPEDVPVYPPDDLYRLSWVIWKTPGEANLAYNVNVQTPKDQETVRDWYRAQLVSNGWTIESEIFNPIDSTIWAIRIEIKAIKADRSLKVTIGNSGDSPLQTNIDIYISVPEG